MDCNSMYNITNNYLLLRMIFTMQQSGNTAVQVLNCTMTSEQDSEWP